VKRLALGVFLFLGLVRAGTYVVQPGDTLWRISQAQRVDLTTLILANHLPGTELHPGQKLLIPERYVVTKGDTLWSLARRFGTSVAELKRLNGLSGDSLRAGQTLWVPAPARPEPAPGVVTVARAYLGRPYRYGAAGPDAFDCSGFVQYVFGKLGIKLPRTAATQWSQLEPVSSPQAGDLVFFSFSGGRVDHVGIYLGDGRFIHANSYERRVVVENLEAPWYRKVYLGARRVDGSQITAAR